MDKFSVRTVIANDRPLMLAGMEYVAIHSGAIELAALCRSTDELIETLQNVRCDVVLLDYSIRGSGNLEGLALLGYLKRTFPDMAIVTLLRHESPVLAHAILQSGVSSIVSKFDEVNHIVTAIHMGYGGGQYLSPKVRSALEHASTENGDRIAKLSPREIEIIRLYLSGLSVGEIAVQLKKGKQTISAQKTSAMKKLGAKTDVALIECAMNLGLGDLSP
ncbi:MULTISPECIES: response regulator transcription factor [Burkholderia]|jgi:DNA-binding NarL/FixJ family response regulator|uniref:Response regulator transcription factor n=2 Tax=Burkholderia multivorans TaxID=87883 RepID=A0AAP2MQ33_9BURK|nr:MULTISPECIES: response regulator transcription factor [Burkholderia]AJY15075.1 bacterial regulatory s, luxR family protein [Burkholderia multivorans ATCC BAA-247]AVR20155.1 DNA-binding response regulator [Burkholderia multivorans]EJO62499.1 response regulator receiver domain protein [Burkholderia multivorans ATCC BAA-247]EKS9916044.1 response regulator transcription factor [Burkholderia multivorans]KOE22691.1 histidine kinase [Burkholderia multivorans R-20526]